MIDPQTIARGILGVWVQAKGLMEWWKESESGPLFGNPRTGERMEWNAMRDGISKQSRIGQGWIRFDKLTGYENDYAPLTEIDLQQLCQWLNGNVASSKRNVIFAFLREWTWMRQMLGGIKGDGKAPAEISVKEGYQVLDTVLPS